MDQGNDRPDGHLGLDRMRQGSDAGGEPARAPFPIAHPLRCIQGRPSTGRSQRMPPAASRRSSSARHGRAHAPFGSALGPVAGSTLTLPGAQTPPAGHARSAAHPLGQALPRRASCQHEQDTSRNGPIGYTGLAALGTRWRGRKQRGDRRPGIGGDKGLSHASPAHSPSLRCTPLGHQHPRRPTILEHRTRAPFSRKGRRSGSERLHQEPCHLMPGLDS